jgi:hypothetical protein
MNTRLRFTCAVLDRQSFQANPSDRLFSSNKLTRGLHTGHLRFHPADNSLLSKIPGRLVNIIYCQATRDRHKAPQVTLRTCCIDTVSDQLTKRFELCFGALAAMQHHQFPT